MIVTYLIEYLGEFEFIFETVLGYVSGGQMDSFEAKKTSRKSHAWAPLNSVEISENACSLEYKRIVSQDLLQRIVK